MKSSISLLHNNTKQRMLSAVASIRLILAIRFLFLSIKELFKFVFIQSWVVWQISNVV